ncbi:conserved protein of unknown function [Cupriavidus taiwanensis]|uniref:Uncharacterized protein n=1 Tax=Cupriavidus taiwanensis TaxID=164546 RepID=A0A375IDH5_9BURK|nr:hypothetical protein [Cupriavidus taiwanensis]SOY56647.1 conserved hypothetical protein [Cupriavidus taiwanensis]SOY57424.1 conserved hypothetical protein [Cupriavidus taiwanensis]SOY79410.1 conserved hypothetical protein [Cupriavidus taiwanensis]SOZ26283.1 conserved hypothetical protein [Cupriavidus taiwanensis]SOZ65319.1 conserved hypothetical protein [Cupriavidus taiwanensis]
MFVCGNQACGASWEPDEVQIRDEGQGLVFRCPQCGARNHVVARTAKDGSTSYRQVAASAAQKAPAQRKAPGKAPAQGRAKPAAR